MIFKPLCEWRQFRVDKKRKMIEVPLDVVVDVKTAAKYINN